MRTSMREDGDCFQVTTHAALLWAADYGINDDAAQELVKALIEDEVLSVKLVQGSVTRASDGLAHTHAWIEGDDTAYDYANGNKSQLPIQVYYYFGKIDEDEVRRFDADEIMTAITDEGHYGPWGDKK